MRQRGVQIPGRRGNLLIIRSRRHEEKAQHAIECRILKIFRHHAFCLAFSRSRLTTVCTCSAVGFVGGLARSSTKKAPGVNWGVKKLTFRLENSAFFPADKSEMHSSKLCK